MGRRKKEPKGYKITQEELNVFLSQFPSDGGSEYLDNIFKSESWKKDMRKMHPWITEEEWKKIEEEEDYP